MTDNPGFFSRFALSIRERSAIGAVLHFIDVALCTLSRGCCRLRGYALIAQPIGNGTSTLTRPHAGTVVQSVAPQHPLARHFPRSDLVNPQRWAFGSQCLAATVNGDFAGTVWLWQAVDSHLQADGIECSFSRISLLNPASMAAHRRMHAPRVGTAVFHSLGSLQVSLFSMSPFVHVGARHHSLPTVRLNVPPLCMR